MPQPIPNSHPPGQPLPSPPGRPTGQPTLSPPPSPAAHRCVEALQRRWPDWPLDPRETVVRGKPVGTVIVTLTGDRLIEAMTFLRDDPATACDMLAELTCVDYLGFPQPQPARLGVTYGLLSTTLGHRLWVKVFVPTDAPHVPTLTGLWASADWLEREVFDMFGVIFDGHRDLRRILTPVGFKHHPLRKDYPLTGLGERERLPVIGRSDA